jgi:hypothetical protein
MTQERKQLSGQNPERAFAARRDALLFSETSAKFWTSRPEDAHYALLGELWGGQIQPNPRLISKPPICHSERSEESRKNADALNRSRDPFR